MSRQTHEGDQSIGSDPMPAPRREETPLSAGTINILASRLPYRALSTMAILAPDGSSPDQKLAAMRVGLAHHEAMTGGSRKPEPGSSE